MSFGQFALCCLSLFPEIKMHKEFSTCEVIPEGGNISESITYSCSCCNKVMLKIKKKPKHNHLIVGVIERNQDPLCLAHLKKQSFILLIKLKAFSLYTFFFFCIFLFQSMRKIIYVEGCLSVL